MSKIISKKKKENVTFLLKNLKSRRSAIPVFVRRNVDSPLSIILDHPGNPGKQDDS